jgi:hypothetical protein
MTADHIHDENESLLAGLAALTRPGGGREVWRDALAKARPKRSLSVFRRTVPNGLTALAAGLVLVVLVGFMLPSMGKARSSRRYAVDAPAPTASRTVEDGMVAGYVEDADRRMLRAEVGQAVTLPDAVEGHESYAFMPGVGRRNPNWGLSTDNQAAGSDRMVIRKATVEMSVPDVRAAFLKATMVLSEAQGEYLEQSSLTGDGASMQGALTLRVAASRLSAVLGELRELGKVTSETAGGEDVTDTMVDLEARLRNEQRVEAELLGLMESRKDAPLKEILELRESINRIRESIERMTAQRERLGRLVSLATVLVILRADAAPPEPVKSDSIVAYFVDQVSRAWKHSLQGLADSVAWLVWVAVGGLMWWILIGAAVMGVVVIRRRIARRAAEEPAPAGFGG